MKLMINTLPKRKDFLRLKEAGKSTTRKSFVLVLATNNIATPSDPLAAVKDNPLNSGITVRLGLTASKKIGNAVQRNRARRRLRELARQLLPKIIFFNDGDSVNMDMVLIARADILLQPWENLQFDFIDAFKQVKKKISKNKQSD